MKNKYSTQELHEACAKALGRDLSISTKHAIVISNFLRGKQAQFGFEFLNDVKDKKKPIPFTRFTDGVGHKRGMGAGRYPVKASIAVLKLLKSAVANAQDKGLNTEGMVIKHINAHKASTPMHMGRKSRRQMKRTHMEIVLEEVEQPKKQTKKSTKKEELAKKEVEKPAQKVEKKEEPTTPSTSKKTTKKTTKKAAKKTTATKKTTKKAANNTTKQDTENQDTENRG